LREKAPSATEEQRRPAPQKWKGNPVPAHLLFIGGEDHFMRLPFMLALKAKGYRVTAAASGDPRPFAEAGVPFRPIHFGRFVSPLRDLGSLRELSQLLTGVDADVAHCFDSKLSVMVALAAPRDLRTLLVRTINGRGWIYSSRSASALALRCLYHPLQRRAAKAASATVFEHNGDFKFFADNHLLRDSEPEIIPGAGVDVEGFERARATGPSREALRKELGLGDSPVVITATRITRQKGIPALLQAAEMVHATHPDVKFLIAGPREGEGPFAMRAEEFERHAGYVVAPGSRGDVPSLLAMADIFAFPTEYAEGVPRAVMEAALAGLPIVASDIAGCREVIEDKWSGLLTPLRDPRALADRVIALLDDREAASAMGARGPALIRRTFSLDNVVDRHAALYERLLTRARLRRALAEPPAAGPTFGEAAE
jgi:glycosyltransferase involved in cell wall biosynthesis